ncbi:MAG TPA: hypothetical protein VEF53_04440 [Patescibacteria group bacterium]|nr:hypothetical protein [Patescibacteria group bacterium]
MSGLDKNRLRNKTISFRVSHEEAIKIDARIKVCGMPKGEYFIQSLLYNNISVTGGKYQSDRLSLELSRLKEELHRLSVINSFYKEITTFQECKALLEEILKVTSTNAGKGKE